MLEVFDFSMCRDRLLEIGFRKPKTRPVFVNNDSAPPEINAKLISFFKVCGNFVGDAYLPISYPTPFGDQTVCRIFDIQRSLEVIASSDSVPSGLIPIADGDGALICVRDSEVSNEQVFVVDLEFRNEWPPESLLAIPSLDEQVRDYFILKKSGTIPPPPLGHENVYIVARSIQEFISQLQPADRL